MKYFTPAWHSGAVEDKDNAVFKSYQTYLAPLLPQWPLNVQALATRISLHDVLIRELSWNTDEATLRLRLRCGDLQVGYFDLDLHYSGVLFSPSALTSLWALKSERAGSALYDEVDEDDGQFVHRILFLLNYRKRRSRRVNTHRGIKLRHRRAKMKLQYCEITIRFDELRLTTMPRNGRFDMNESF